jgi:leucyl-tRNA synthetase
VAENSTAEYNPRLIEKKWQKYWEDNKTFATPTHANAKKAYILDMFPYPSGAGLHIGHPVGYTGSDILARFRRHQGYSVLHPMGYDSFGLPTEQHALATGKHPADVTKQNCTRFTEQLKNLGFAYDWDREIATSDPEYYRWTQWIFLKLYNSWFDASLQKARPISELTIPNAISEQGELAVQAFQAEHRLAYMNEGLVNWCPALGTVLANEEVIDGKSERGGHDVIRKPMRQWFLRITAYSERLIDELEGVDWPESIKEQQRHWIGRRNGTNVTFQVDGSDHAITTFTTRPDTLFGVTFVVLAPEHPLVLELTTKEQSAAVEEYREKAARLSDLDRTIENKPKTGVATGSFVINPITGRKVPLYVGDYVLMGFGTGAVMGVPSHDERDFVFAKQYAVPVVPVIKPSADAKTIEATLAGDLCWPGDGTMIAHTAATDGNFSVEGKTNEEAKSLITAWLTRNSCGEAITTYRIRDWLFSRQRYWGEPFPIIHWEDGTVSCEDESTLPLALPPTNDFKPAETGESPLARIDSWVNVTCPTSGKKGKRETNTMPQWAGSCWYYLRFIDPHNASRFCDDALEKEWMPVDFYIGGAEHAVLHLLYARFWHKLLFDLGFVSTKEPFQRLFNQGMLVSHAFKDSRGALIPVDLVEENADGVPVKIDSGEKVERIIAKMSKSLKNVVNPEDITDQYGSDTLRVFLMFMAPLEAIKPWSSEAIVGCYRFLKRSWALIVDDRTGELKATNSENDIEITKALHKAIKKVTIDTDAIRFNTAISGLMEFLNDVSGKTISVATAKAYAILLSPFAPHIAEELWSKLGGAQSIAQEPWPIFDDAYLVQTTATVVIQIAGKRRAEIQTEITASDDEIKALVLKAMADSAYAVTANDKFIVVRDRATNQPKLANVIPGKA